MLFQAFLSFASLTGAIQPPEQDYDPVKEVIGKNVESITAAQKKNPKLGFSQHSSFFGAVVNQNSSVAITFTPRTGGDFTLFYNAYGNDVELKVQIADSAGRKVTAKGDDFQFASFKAIAGNKYSISIQNMGADSFVGASLMLNGGIRYPLTGFNVAAHKIAATIGRAQKDGFKAARNTIFIEGGVVAENGSLSRPTLESPNWMAFAVSDGKPGQLHMDTLDSTKQVLQSDTGEDIDCVSIFNQPVKNGTVKNRNTQANSMFVLSGMMIK